jgi:putative transposase
MSRQWMTPNTVSYGAKRVWRDLMAEGISCGPHRIESLRRLQALKGRPGQSRLSPDLGAPQIAAVAANVLDGSFAAPAPDHKWNADFTSVWTAEGLLYVVAIPDLFFRRVVGWSINAAMESFFSFLKTEPQRENPIEQRRKPRADV